MLDNLQKTHFGEPFSFLDIGCGSGWVVRRVAAHPNCVRAVGVDVSGSMIRTAQKMRSTPKEEYHTVSLEAWVSQPFTVAFSMESLYYAESMPQMISKIYSLLKPGGVCVCGTDYYTENIDTAHWGMMMNIPIHMHSESEWVDMFAGAGFDASSYRIRNAQSSKRWKQRQGTLVITAVRH